jgi:hypothetical protein
MARGSGGAVAIVALGIGGYLLYKSGAFGTKAGAAQQNPLAKALQSLSQALQKMGAPKGGPSAGGASTGAGGSKTSPQSKSNTGNVSGSPTFPDFGGEILAGLEGSYDPAARAIFDTSGVPLDYTSTGPTGTATATDYPQSPDLIPPVGSGGGGGGGSFDFGSGDFSLEM